MSPHPLLVSLTAPSQQKVAQKAFWMGCAFFFTSGASALIYEILWIRFFGLIFGNTTFAVATVLAVYMAGLGLGSYWMGRIADRWRSPLALYGSLELGIGIYAAFTFLLIRVVQNLYVVFAQQTDPSPALFTLVRLILSSIILFIPTFFMGATLPVLAKFYIRRTSSIGPGTALLYALNTAGAVSGTLLTGFSFLPTLGMQRTLAIAVTLNLGIGLLAWILSKELKKAGIESVGDTFQKTSLPEPPTIPPAFPRVDWLPAGLFVSGALAMIYEVTWTRILATVLGSSTYAFTVMVGTFLLGIALGSALYEGILSRRNARLADWAYLHLVIALSVLLTLPLFERVGLLTVRLFALTLGHPKWLELMRFIVSSGLMIVPTICFGALFPVSVALYSRDAKVVGRDIGSLYLANTIGNILGSLAAGFVAIPTLGIHRTFLLTIGAGALLGFGISLLEPKRSKREWAGLALITFLLACGLWSFRKGWDPRLIAGGLHVRPESLVTQDTAGVLAVVYDREPLFYREGVSSIVTVEQIGDARFLKVNGKTDAGTGIDMMTQVFLGHLPHLLHPKPERSLIIGFGSGTTLAAALVHPVRRVDCVEIEPAVLEAASFFHSVNRETYKDPRTRLITNDGRNHLLIEPTTYDVIVSEPSNPWMAGVSNLFTVEFYELVAKRLAPDGVFCQWLQSYSIAPQDFRMVVASIQKVLPEVTIWQTVAGDYLMIASRRPLFFDLDRIQSEVDRTSQLRQDLSQFEIHTAAGLLASFILDASDVKEYVRDSPLHTDDLLFLEFHTPWTLYDETGPLIAQALSSYRSRPYPAIRTTGTPPDQDPEILVEIAEAHLFKNQTWLVRDLAEKAFQINPSFSNAQVLIARSDFADELYLKALSRLETVSQSDPRSAGAKAHLGWVRLKLNEDDAALQSLEEASRLDDKKWKFFSWKAKALERLNRWPEAAEAYRQSMKLKGYQPFELELGYGRSLLKAGDIQQATLWFEKLHRDYKTHPSVYEELGRAYQAARNFDQGVGLFEEATRINPYRSRYWEILASFYLLKGDQERLADALIKGERAKRYFADQFITARRDRKATPPSVPGNGHPAAGDEGSPGSKNPPYPPL